MTERERTKTILKEYGFTAKKSFGQNFLVDDGIIRRIVKNMAVSEYETVIEIGPGLGALSLPLSKEAKRIYLVDADRDMVKVLRDLFAGQEKVTVVQSDFLRFDPDSVSRKEERLFIGNLPYNITSRLLEYMLEKGFRSAGFMVQKEVYEKLDYRPGKKDNTPLGAFIAASGDLSLVSYVDRSAFDPSPKVDSAFLRIDRTHPVSFSLYPIFKALFKDPNKTISNCLRQFDKYLPALEKMKEKRGERLAKRARQLTTEELSSLAEEILEFTKENE